MLGEAKETLYTAVGFVISKTGLNKITLLLC